MQDMKRRMKRSRVYCTNTLHSALQHYWFSLSSVIVELLKLFQQMLYQNHYVFQWIYFSPGWGGYGLLLVQKKQVSITTLARDDFGCHIKQWL